MTVEISYRWRHTENWFTMHESVVSHRSPADMYALVIDGKRTFQNESLEKVLTVQRRVVHTAKLLEMSIVA